MTEEIHIPPTPEEIAVRLDHLERLLFDRSPIIDGDETEPTRTNVTKTQRGGETVELEWNSIHSVEITNTAKEGPRISKVKVYDADPIAAARVAASLFAEASSQLANMVAADSRSESGKDANPEEPAQ